MELKEVYAAHRRIRGQVRETPLEHSPHLSELCGGEVWLKLENLQLTGSFKIRGALNKLLQLSEEAGRRHGLLRQVQEHDPLKQGLKPDNLYFRIIRLNHVQEHDPLKQGLKLSTPGIVSG